MSTFGLFLLALFWGQGTPQTNSAPTDSKQSASVDAGQVLPDAAAKKLKLSYVLGNQFSQSLNTEGVEFDLDELLRGFHDGLAGKSEITRQEADMLMRELQRELTQKRRERQMALLSESKKESERFMSANKEKQGVVALPSGLQYKVLKEGAGKSPLIGDTVKVDYKGMLPDGTLFDQTTEGRPATFKVKQVIPGWIEALQLMNEGGKWEIYVPPELGYGAKGFGPKIPANAALVFEIELLEVLPTEPPKE